MESLIRQAVTEAVPTVEEATADRIAAFLVKGLFVIIQSVFFVKLFKIYQCLHSFRSNMGPIPRLNLPHFNLMRAVDSAPKI